MPLCLGDKVEQGACALHAYKVLGMRIRQGGVLPYGIKWTLADHVNRDDQPADSQVTYNSQQAREGHHDAKPASWARSK
jgi:hypothetical protein